MADKKSADQPEKKGGKSKLLLPIIVLVVAGGGYYMGGMGGGGGEAASEEAAVEEVEVEPVVGTVVQLDAVNINLADGHYLRVAVGLGINEETVHAFEEEHGGGHGAEVEFEYETAPASDLVVATFLGRQMEELVTLDGREAARDDLFHGLEEYYGEDIVTVYLTEFVMQ